MYDRERWDGKYSGEAGRTTEAPEPFLLTALERLGAPEEGDRALDLAAGTGRHAIHLAGLGYEVTAWDVSPVGLSILAQRARAAGVAVVTHAVDLLVRSSDGSPDEAQGQPFGLGAPFDLVVCVLFLDRDLLARMGELVVPGGHLIFATRTSEWPGERPPARYRLRPGELPSGLAGFETLLVDERDGSAGLLARREST